MVDVSRVLVTGGAGFIGSHIVDKLKARDYDVSVLDNLSAGRKENLSNVPLTVKSVSEVEKFDVEGFDAVIHCAAQVSTFWSVDYPHEDFASNCLGTFNLFEACRKWNDDALIIYTSSRSVHGNIPPPHVADESSPFSPSTFYNVHKLYGENLAKIYSELYGMRFIVLRPSNVYGQRQPYWMKGWYNFLSYWILLGLKGEAIPIYGTGEQVRDYTHVGDVAEAYVHVLENGKAVGETFLLGMGEGTTLNELADLVIKRTGNRSEKAYYPLRKGDIQRFVGSHKKATDMLGWTPKIELDEGLRLEVEWLRSEMSNASKGSTPP